MNGIIGLFLVPTPELLFRVRLGMLLSPLRGACRIDELAAERRKKGAHAERGCQNNY